MNSPCDSCDGYEKDECHSCRHEPKPSLLEIVAFAAIIGTFYLGLFGVIGWCWKKLTGG